MQRVLGSLETLAFNMPAICHKNISNVITNKLTPLAHVESLISFARSNKTIDSKLYKDYITRYALLGDHVTVAKEITCMEGDGFPIDTSVMNIHLMTFKYSANSDIAKEVMEGYKKRGLEPDGETFTHQMKHFIRVHDFDSALGICSEMLSYPSISPTHRYNALIYVHGRKGDLDECLKIGQKMEEEGIEWDEETYGAIVKALVRKGEHSRARIILNNMEKKGLVFDSSLHSHLLISLAKVGDVKGCLQLLEEMATIGLYPNFLAYLDMIDIFCAANNVHMAVKLVGEMKERDFFPPSKTYEALVKLCWNAGDSVSLSSVISTIKKGGPILPAHIYHGLMDHYDKLGNMKRSLALGEDLVERKETLTEPFYSKMISLYERTGNLDKCITLLREAIQFNIRPLIYPSLFFSFHRSGDFQVCLELFNVMKARGTVDELICDKVVDIHMAANQIKEATDFLYKIDESSIILLPATYGKLIQAWGRTNRLDICTQLFKKMRDKEQIPLPITYDILLAAYGRQRDLVACKQLWSDAAKNLSASDIGPMYNPMISTYAIAGDMKGAVQLWRDAKEKGITLLENTYITLINAHGKKGELKAVAGLFEEVVQKNIQHGDKLYSALLRVFTEHGRVEKGPISLASLLKLHGKNQELEKILNDVKQFKTIQTT